MRSDHIAKVVLKGMGQEMNILFEVLEIKSVRHEQLILIFSG